MPRTRKEYFIEPGSRDSDYFATREGAECVLKAVENALPWQDGLFREPPSNIIRR